MPSAAKRPSLRQMLSDALDADDESFSAFMKEIDDIDADLMASRPSDTATDTPAPHHNETTEEGEVLALKSTSQDADVQSGTRATHKCRLCVEDVTVPRETQDKNHRSERYLKDHMESTYHSKRARWYRMYNLRHDEQVESTGDELFHCPYGSIDHPQRSQTSMGRLVAHIHNSNPAKHGQLHDDQKMADGWNDKDWNGEANSRSKKEALADGHRRLKTIGVVLPKDEVVCMQRQEGSAFYYGRPENLDDMVSERNFKYMRGGNDPDAWRWC